MTGLVLLQLRAQLIAVVRLVPEHAFGRLHATDQALGKWTVEAYAGVWFFTTNTSYYPAGTSERSQDPLASYQGHVSYTFRPGPLSTPLTIRED